MTAPDPAETVPVPRVLVEALREFVGDCMYPPAHWRDHEIEFYFNARALVEAADSPPVNEPRIEPLCQCIETKATGEIDSTHCEVHAPAPSPSTREALPTTPGSDEAEAEEAWEGTTAVEDAEVVNAILPQMRALLAAEMLTIVERIAKRHFKAGFRAARGEEA